MASGKAVSPPSPAGRRRSDAAALHDAEQRAIDLEADHGADEVVVLLE
jgi:hypothetical protein